MDLVTVLLSVITGGGVILGFFIKLWMNGLKEQNVSLAKDIKAVKEELGTKADIIICNKIHVGVKQLLHTHAASGDCGEMVKMEGGL